MKAKTILLILMLVSVNASSKEFSFTAEQIKNRKKHVLKKNGKVIGYKSIDETSYDPKLKKFVTKLKKALEESDKEQLVQLLASNFNCDRERVETKETCIEYITHPNNRFESTRVFKLRQIQACAARSH